MKKRIWELDVLRGICILAMVAVHLVFDLVYIYGTLTLEGFGQWLFDLLTQWGGVLFLLISGICVTLGSHPVRRGLTVFGCGMLCTLATWLMYWLGFMDQSVIIYFGVLHCLGICMLLWPLVKKLPAWALGILGVILVAVGLYLPNLRVDTPWLLPLGLMYPGFASSDYFPLLPNLGFFLLGAVLGLTLYRKKQTLLPKVNEKNFMIRFFSVCGKWSLWIYLLHQPLMTVALELIF